MSSSDRPSHVISLPGGITDSVLGPPNEEHNELDALFQATRQVEATVTRERAQAERIKNDLMALQSRYARESAHAQQQLRKYSAQNEEFRAQLSKQSQNFAAQTANFQAKFQALSAHAQKLQEVVTRQHAEQGESNRKSQLELNVAKAALAQATQQNQQLRGANETLQPRLGRAEGDIERLRAEIEDRETKYQASLLSYQNQQKHLNDTITSLNLTLERSQAELARHKSNWNDTIRIQQQAAAEGKRHEESVSSLRQSHESLAVEKRRRQQSEEQAKAAEGERDMLLSCLRSTEARLAEAETRLSQALSEIALSRTTRKPMPQPDRKAPKLPSADELEALEQLAMMGFPVVRG